MSADGSAAVADMFISMAVIFVHLMQPDTSLDVSEECRVPCKILYKFYKDIEEIDILHFLWGILFPSIGWDDLPFCPVLQAS